MIGAETGEIIMQPRYDAVVIGAGIFGSVITKALRKKNMSVLTLDCKYANSGSAPAACLMRPSWASSMSKENYAAAIAQLDDLVGVQDIVFQLPLAGGLKGSATVQWCDPKLLLLPEEEVTFGLVKRVGAGGRLSWETQYTNDEGLFIVASKLVIVAAGIWSQILNSEATVTGQAGVAWLWPKAKIEEPFIKVWAPYKQLVAFNRGDGLWVGDGTSVKNWQDKYRIASLARCRAVVSATEEPRVLFGYRPYVQWLDTPCMFKQTQRGLWVATGGAKNGTLAAGWCADQISRW
jgi:hypothetical protein